MRISRSEQRGVSGGRHHSADRDAYSGGNSGANRGPNNRGAGNTPGASRLAWLGRLAKILFSVAMVTGVGVGAAWIYTQLDVPVAAISVESAFERVSRDEIEALVAPHIAGGFLSLGLAEIRDQLEQNPWIESASARRQWPSGLAINIVEETPIARWGDAGFLNHRGVALAIGNVAGLEHLPILDGPVGSERKVMQEYREISQLLQPVGLRISEFRGDARGAWQLQLQDGPVVLMGRGQLMEKIRRFLVVWERELRPRAAQVARVDTRYNNGVAVQWRVADGAG